MKQDHHSEPLDWPDDVPAEACTIDGPLRVRGMPDLIALIPYLLGFHPDESVVIVVCVAGRVALTARFDIGDCRHPRALRARLWAIQDHCASARFFLAAYADDPQRAHDALGLVEQAFDADSVLDSVVVGQDRYWSRMCSQEGCCPPGGVVFDPETSPIALRAIAQGLQALPRRSDLERRIALPRGGAVGLGRRRCSRARAAVAAIGRGGRLKRIDALLDRGLAEDACLADDDLAELAVWLHEGAMRDRALRRLDRTNADRHVQLWERVVRATPRDERVPALCVLALAAWVSGDGALQVVCMSQAEQIDPGFGLLDMLADINAMAAPPSVWDQMLADLARGGADEPVR